MNTYTFKQIAVGMSEEFTKTITDQDVKQFTQLSGDTNPLHTNTVYAKTTTFEKPVIHGMLLSSYLSTLVGMHLPGKHALFMGANIQFKQPCYENDTITIQGKVIQKIEATHMILIDATIATKTHTVLKATLHVKVLQ